MSGNKILLAANVLACGSLAFGHIRIAPAESTQGAREKYTMRVPERKAGPQFKDRG